MTTVREVAEELMVVHGIGQPTPVTKPAIKKLASPTSISGKFQDGKPTFELDTQSYLKQQHLKA